MNSEEIYNAWKEQRSQIRVSEGFSHKVMKQVGQYEQGRRTPLFDVERFVEFVSGMPLAKAGLIATGAVIGLVRIALVAGDFFPYISSAE